MKIMKFFLTFYKVMVKIRQTQKIRTFKTHIPILYPQIERPRENNSPLAPNQPDTLIAVTYKAVYVIREVLGGGWD